MKGSKFLIFGSLVVAGIIAYEIYKRYNSKKDDYHEIPLNTENTFDSNEITVLYTDPHSPSVTGFNEIKESAINSVNKRHYEAAKSIEESLNTIFKENEDETIVTENSEILDQISNDLNDLLK